LAAILVAVMMDSRGLIQTLVRISMSAMQYQPLVPLSQHVQITQARSLVRVPLDILETALSAKISMNAEFYLIQDVMTEQTASIRLDHSAASVDRDMTVLMEQE